MALTAKKIRQYVKDGKNGKTDMFVYALSGTESELQEYIDHKGEYIRWDDDNPTVPLLFTSVYVLDEMPVRFSVKQDRYIIDTNEINSLKAQVKYFGGDLGEAYANAVANKLVSRNSPAPKQQKQLSLFQAEPETAENVDDIPF